MNIHTDTLPNGLRIVCHHNPMTAMAAVGVLYDVGARDEKPGRTGLAHLFEHLMFAGSVNIPDFDGALECAGAETNAWTSNDFTYFHCTVPAANIETVFWAESDRMLSLSFSEKALETQKNVVIEEFRQTTLNPPYGDIMQHFRPLAYKVHPYSHTVIGESPEQIAATTIDEIRDIFFTHYGPDTAILSVAGPTPPERIFELAGKWFGDIPPRNRPARNLPAEPEQTESREMQVSRGVPSAHILMGYHTDPYGTADYRAADFLTDILSLGHSSRTYRRMTLGTDLFSNFDTSVTGSEDNGLLLINARLKDNSPESIEKALAMTDEFVESILSEEITQQEVLRAQNQFEANMVFSNVSNSAKALTMAMNLYHGETPDMLLKQAKSLTPEIVNATARKILRPQNRSTLIYT